MNVFDEDKAFHFLKSKSEVEKESMESFRKKTLEKTISYLKSRFERETVEIYLVGSILKP
jgi:hypothetical protein